MAVGLMALGFGVSPAQMATAIGVSLGAQGLGSMLLRGRFDWKSPLISGLSLSLLLRADGLWPFALAAALSIGSKFAIRAGDRHIFNPANFGIVLMVAFSGAAWTSTGEWGGAPWFAAMIAALGAVTCWRASRLDVPIIYLGVFAALVVGRALYLGDPLSIPALRLSHGALILFAFFMISDPVTTPMDSRQRALFVSAAAALAYIGQFHFFISDAIFYAPFAVALLRLLAGDAGAGARYQWGTAPGPLRFIFHARGRASAPAE
ncbi:MAG: RnfABCDGE type electron transport complex subunit D [Parvularculaceae bacterium]|nr:RnfABCDGE type electron transport complex subunit D [Parvularculaceae bacterium]